MHKFLLCLAATALLTYGPTAAAESLRVNLEPIAAVELQMRWRLTGETIWRPSGDTIDNLKPGIYSVELSSTKDCRPKFDINEVRVLRGVTTHTSFEYTGAACTAPVNLKVVIGRSKFAGGEEYRL